MIILDVYVISLSCIGHNTSLEKYELIEYS